MNIFAIASLDGLKEMKENGLKWLEISPLKNLIVKPQECISDAELEDLVKKREEIKREIKKLNQEKKRIETRIHRIRKAAKEKCEEITEFPWREEIFPPLPRKTFIKSPESLAVEGPALKDNTLQAENSGFLEDKQSGENKQRLMGTEVKGVNEKLEAHTPVEKRAEDIASTTINTMTANNAEGTESKNRTEQKDMEKTFLGKEEKTKAVYPFSAGKLNENRTPASNNSMEQKKIESKNSPAASLLGENLIEELLSSDDLNPEEEQSFMKYLQEQGTGELIKELKDIRYLLSRAEQVC